MSKYCCIALLIILCLSCNDQASFSDYQSINGEWDKNERINFTFQPEDTLSKNQLYLHVRNNNEYEFSNLYLIATLSAPDGLVQTDTLQYEMAKADGTWLGTGFTDVKENKLWYKQDYVFKNSGEYLLEVGHAMRKNGEVQGIGKLKGITEIGFSIEKAPN
ncbi:gliding motility lipoprotein GldH [Spongiivirga citrea]|uniref:Gliding motility lipoprotein GldH n=1 Tax=Spongiivirga citrea TaxID=1481457 RepID=A0A6M0CJF9_9FLAO|nr:gliding motility lipoprotein GldH [Spongiivirga citrea]NER17981.1 gliding motility lipoprotein GldH [Spongiivirga citrea]